MLLSRGPIAEYCPVGIGGNGVDWRASDGFLKLEQDQSDVCALSTKFLLAWSKSL